MYQAKTRTEFRSFVFLGRLFGTVTRTLTQPLTSQKLSEVRGEFETKRPGAPAGAPNRISGLRLYKKITAITG